MREGGEGAHRHSFVFRSSGSSGAAVNVAPATVATLDVGRLLFCGVTSDAQGRGDTILQIEQWRATQQMNGRDVSDRALNVTARIVGDGGDCCGFSALPCHIDFSFAAASGTQLTGEGGAVLWDPLLKGHH